nr:[Fe-Fe] hydrogenase large subunit C-terminal domain-containing protein [bacterium]
MAEFLRLKQSNCKNCYKCIRQCPVKSIRFSDNQAHIIEEECVLCGQCFIACPQGAKEIRNDVDRVRDLIASGRPVYASVAPSFVANYEGSTIATLGAALARLGFAGAEETAIGATIVKNRYDQMLENDAPPVIISSCCHSVNLLIQKKFPELLPYLAPVISPMQAHGKVLKAAHPGAAVVFIGPCISKKAEAEQYPGIIDCALTFEELTGWLAQEGLSLAPGSDTNPQSRARLFPTAGGILRTMACRRKDISYLTIDGMDNCIQALKDIAEGSLTGCFIEMSACPGSCIGGPGLDKGRRAPIRDAIAVNRAAGQEDFPVTMPPSGELTKKMGFMGARMAQPSAQAIREILAQMGKTRPEHELNCGSCGYNTCREKAIAVYMGKADLSMCLPFLKEKAESFSDTIINNTPNGIIVLNEGLEVQQINAAARRMMNIASASDVLGGPVVRIMDPQPFFNVLETGRSQNEQRIYLAEYKRYAAMSIHYDASYHILICILRDITQEELSRAGKDELRQKTIETADKVIEKQMRVVQEIASLLGETTAETKIALTNLKESLEDE